MAESPAHKFGQIIGELLEIAIELYLSEFARRHNLYLDKKGERPAREGSKVSWEDRYGNKHDLDFVIERGGTDTHKGIPISFIETAWRRYTKHSRNKAQEIQGAILPLVETYSHHSPFIGAILAGVFTSGALAQLKSHGFTVLYFPYETIIKAFARVHINAAFDEETTDNEFKRKIHAWRLLDGGKRRAVAEEMVRNNSKEVKNFMEALESSIIRQINSVSIIPLHGTEFKLDSIREAIAFIEKYNESKGSAKIVRYEVEIRYNNGDRIVGQFVGREETIKFLRTYQPY